MFDSWAWIATPITLHYFSAELKDPQSGPRRRRIGWLKVGGEILLWQGSASIASWNWEKYCHSKLVSTCQCCRCPCYPGEYLGFEPSSVINEPRYLKLVTVSSFCPFILISVLMPLVLSSAWSSQHWSPCRRLWRNFFHDIITKKHWFSVSFDFT